MKTAVIYDCEFLTLKDSPSRFWCGPFDPDPIIVQIGAVKLGLEDNFPILENLRSFVVPVDRHKNPYQLDRFFVELTGITQATIDENGVGLQIALTELHQFAGNADFWSWGKDEFNMLAISCYVAGIAPPIPATKFKNACALILKAGMPQEDLNRTRSNTLADYYQLDTSALQSHDALDDALSVAYSLQHLLRSGALRADDFDA